MDAESRGDAPEVSVIIACHNACVTLPLQLEALSRQQDAPSFEVIVSDNGSDDELLSLVGIWADRLDIRYVWSGQVSGAGYARNVGMSIARADKWLFCDADDVVGPDWVARGADVLDAAPVFSGGAIHETDAQLGDPLDVIWERLGAQLPPNLPVIADARAQWPIVMGGNFGVRRAVALSIGGFDAAMARGVEDNDLAIRLEDAGQLISAGGTRIAYRRRDDLADIWHRSLVSGRWHMALVGRHGIAGRSPVLRGRRWMYGSLRVVGAALKNAVKGRRGDWLAVITRAGVAAGLWRGWMDYRIGHRLPGPLIGAGLGGRRPSLSDDAAVLVLSPHLDDALFSCAELIRQTRPEVWTVFAGDPQPAVTTAWDETCGFADSHTLVTQRRREDVGAFDGTGARVRHLDMLDGVYTSPVRRAEDLARLDAEVRGWVLAHRGRTPVVVLPACAGVSVPPGVMDRVMDRLKPLLDVPRTHSAGRETPEAQAKGNGDPAVGLSPDDGKRATSTALLRVPVSVLKRVKHRLYQGRRTHAQRTGLAVNGDHVAVRDAVLDALAAIGTDASEEVRVLLAEDLPYLWSQPGDDEVRRLADVRNAVVRPFEFHVDRDWKHARIAHYTSQLEIMDPVHHRFNRPDTIPPVERCWEFAIQEAETNRSA